MNYGDLILLCASESYVGSPAHEGSGLRIVYEGLLLDSIPTHSLHQRRKVESQGL